MDRNTHNMNNPDQEGGDNNNGNGNGSGGASGTTNNNAMSAPVMVPPGWPYPYNMAVAASPGGSAAPSSYPPPSYYQQQQQYQQQYNPYDYYNQMYNQQAAAAAMMYGYYNPRAGVYAPPMGYYYHQQAQAQAQAQQHQPQQPHQHQQQQAPTTNANSLMNILDNHANATNANTNTTTTTTTTRMNHQPRGRVPEAATGGEAAAATVTVENNKKRKANEVTTATSEAAAAATAPSELPKAVAAPAAAKKSASKKKKKRASPLPGEKKQQQQQKVVQEPEPGEQPKEPEQEPRDILLQYLEPKSKNNSSSNSNQNTDGTTNLVPRPFLYGAPDRSSGYLTVNIREGIHLPRNSGYGKDLTLLLDRRDHDRDEVLSNAFVYFLEEIGWMAHHMMYLHPINNYGCDLQTTNNPNLKGKNIEDDPMNPNYNINANYKLIDEDNVVQCLRTFMHPKHWRSGRSYYGMDETLIPGIPKRYEPPHGAEARSLYVACNLQSDVNFIMTEKETQIRKGLRRLRRKQQEQQQQQQKKAGGEEDKDSKVDEEEQKDDNSDNIEIDLNDPDHLIRSAANAGCYAKQLLPNYRYRGFTGDMARTGGSLMEIVEDSKPKDANEAKKWDRLDKFVRAVCDNGSRALFEKLSPVDKVTIDILLGGVGGGPEGDYYYGSNLPSVLDTIYDNLKGTGAPEFDKVFPIPPPSYRLDVCNMLPYIKAALLSSTRIDWGLGDKLTPRAAAILTAAVSAVLYKTYQHHYLDKKKIVTDENGDKDDSDKSTNGGSGDCEDSIEKKRKAGEISTTAEEEAAAPAPTTSTAVPTGSPEEEETPTTKRDNLYNNKKAAAAAPAQAVTAIENVNNKEKEQPQEEADGRAPANNTKEPAHGILGRYRDEKIESSINSRDYVIDMTMMFPPNCPYFLETKHDLKKLMVGQFVSGPRDWLTEAYRYFLGQVGWIATHLMYHNKAEHHRDSNNNDQERDHEAPRQKFLRCEYTVIDEENIIQSLQTIMHPKHWRKASCPDTMAELIPGLPKWYEPLEATTTCSKRELAKYICPTLYYTGDVDDDVLKTEFAIRQEHKKRTWAMRRQRRHQLQNQQEQEVGEMDNGEDDDPDSLLRSLAQAGGYVQNLYPRKCLFHQGESTLEAELGHCLEAGCWTESQQERFDEYLSALCSFGSRNLFLQLTPKDKMEIDESLGMRGHSDLPTALDTMYDNLEGTGATEFDRIFPIPPRECRLDVCNMIPHINEALSANFGARTFNHKLTLRAAAILTAAVSAVLHKTYQHHYLGQEQNEEEQEGEEDNKDGKSNISIDIGTAACSKDEDQGAKDDEERGASAQHNNCNPAVKQQFLHTTEAKLPDPVQDVVMEDSIVQEIHSPSTSEKPALWEQENKIMSAVETAPKSTPQQPTSAEEICEQEQEQPSLSKTNPSEEGARPPDSVQEVAVEDGVSIEQMASVAASSKETVAQENDSMAAETNSEPKEESDDSHCDHKEGMTTLIAKAKVLSDESNPIQDSALAYGDSSASGESEALEKNEGTTLAIWGEQPLTDLAPTPPETAEPSDVILGHAKEDKATPSTEEKPDEAPELRATPATAQQEADVVEKAAPGVSEDLLSSAGTSTDHEESEEKESAMKPAESSKSHEETTQKSGSQCCIL